MISRSLPVLCLCGIGLALVASAATNPEPATAPATLPIATQPVETPPPVPVPLLTPEQELATFNLPEGFRAEIVAAEPMVEHPVAMAFDPDGRLWVAEMRSYMPDVTGWGEEKPTGRVSVLQDTDGDGRMDKSTVFLDKLVLPRAIGFTSDGGVMVGTPPNLLFCRDLDGDLVSDEQTVVSTNFGVVGNPENFANGLLWGLDNWIYNADHNERIRYLGDGKFEFEPLPVMGQWGITHDDFGRLMFNTNSDYLRVAHVPPHYASRNPSSPISIADTRIAKRQDVWPAHAATINRGYLGGFLRTNGRLAKFTAACSPLVYRDTLLGEVFYGNVFACEATSNLVRRAIVTEKDAMLSADNAYPDGIEFLTSTYERFRPVHLQTGPEGALYIADMHHGLIQHRLSITEYAKTQYKKKELDEHLRTGRIFRIVPDSGAPSVRPNLSRATQRELVKHLTHPNGWWRDTAQRLLVGSKSSDAIEPLRELALRGPRPMDRVRALWTLDGMDRLDTATICTALADAEAKVRAHAIRLAEPVLSGNQGEQLLAEVLKLSGDDATEVRLQLILTTSGLNNPQADAAVAALLHDHGGDHRLREAAVTGLAQREVEFLRRLLEDPSWSTRSETLGDVITDVARSVTRRFDAASMTALAGLLGDIPADRAWQQLALLEAIPAYKAGAYETPRPFEVSQKPAAIEVLENSPSEAVRKRASKVSVLFYWPGKPVPQRPKAPPFTPRQKELFEIGKKQYALICAQCHQPNGMGLEGKAPPLVNSPWVLGPEKRIIRIVLHGMRGPITLGDRTFNMDMPALGAMTDEQIAAVLTYVRREWGHEAAAVDPATVQSIRDWTQARREGWTEKELLEMK